jgi:hypothetical protein
MHIPLRRCGEVEVGEGCVWFTLPPSPGVYDASWRCGTRDTEKINDPNKIEPEVRASMGMEENEPEARLMIIVEGE